MSMKENKVLVCRFVLSLFAFYFGNQTLTNVLDLPLQTHIYLMVLSASIVACVF